MFDDRSPHARFQDDQPVDTPDFPIDPAPTKSGNIPWFWLIVAPAVVLMVAFPVVVEWIGRALGYLLFVMMIVWIARLFRG